MDKADDIVLQPDDSYLSMDEFINAMFHRGEAAEDSGKESAGPIKED